MGNNGNASDDQSVQIAEFERDSDRIYIPKRLGELGGLKGGEQVECWLLVISPGHYRLAVRPQKMDPDSDLTDVLGALEAAKEPGDLLTGTDSDPKAAIPFRLIPVTAFPKKGAWRLAIPEVPRLLAPSGDAAKFVYLSILAGYLEIWFPETLKQALSVPISRTLD